MLKSKRMKVKENKNYAHVFYAMDTNDCEKKNQLFH